jgi:hypothetical protein
MEEKILKVVRRDGQELSVGQTVYLSSDLDKAVITAFGENNGVVWAAFDVPEFGEWDVNTPDLYLTPELDEPDSLDYTFEDMPRFHSQEVDEETNKPDLLEWVENGVLEALVDEESGGIIGYISHVHMSKVLKRLNDYKK